MLAVPLILAFCKSPPLPPPSAAAHAPKTAPSRATGEAAPEAARVERFFLAHGTVEGARFDFALARRGDEAFGIFVPDGGARASVVRGHATGGEGDFRFVVGDGVRLDGRVVSGAVRALEVQRAERKGPVPATLAGAPVAPPEFEQTYAGSFGDEHVRMKLRRSGASLSGVFRDPRSLEEIRVQGRVSADGAFVLDQPDLGGRFEGVLVDQTALLAQWTSSDGKRTSELALTGGAFYPETRPLGHGRVVPRERFADVGPFCTDDSIVPRFAGVGDASAERALDVATSAQAAALGSPLTKADCAGATEAIPYERTITYSVDGERGPFVGATFSLEEFTGGAHGAYASRCVVVDLRRRSVVRLASELSPAGRAKIAKLAVRALEKKNHVTKLTDAGFFQDAPDLDDADVCFATREDGKAELRVDFPLYSIAPYVLGMPEVALDAKDVAGVFQPGTAGAALFP